MEPALKQRLLGAAVIVALAVIIIPFLLDGSGTEPVSEVPLPPEPQTEQQGPLVVEEPVPSPPQPPQSRIIDQPSAPPAASEPPVAEPELPAEPTPSTPQAALPKAAPGSSPSAEPGPAPEPSVPETAAAPEPAAEPEPEPEPATEPAPQPESQSATAKTDTAVSAWVVQVGSFSQQDKATALRDRLRKQEFKAFVEGFKAGNGNQMYRVRVGPVPERAEAERLQQTLAAQESLQGYVTQHP